MDQRSNGDNRIARGGLNHSTPDETRQKAIAYFQGRVKPFTQEEVQELLGVSRFTLLRARRDKKLRVFVSGKVLRYHVEDVYLFLMSQTA